MFLLMSVCSQGGLHFEWRRGSAFGGLHSEHGGLASKGGDLHRGGAGVCIGVQTFPGYTWDMVNRRAVRILLESFLVEKKISLWNAWPHNIIYTAVYFLMSSYECEIGMSGNFFSQSWDEGWKPKRLSFRNRSKEKVTPPNPTPSPPPN